MSDYLFSQFKANEFEALHKELSKVLDISQDPNCDRGIHLNKKDRTRFIQVLKAELEIFEPVAIVTWGKKASSAIRSIELEVKHLEFPHPSGAAHHAWGRLMGKPATRENRINFWQEKVFAHLSGL